jgi:hypothetical protein
VDSRITALFFLGTYEINVLCSLKHDNVSCFSLFLFFKNAPGISALTNKLYIEFLYSLKIKVFYIINGFLFFDTFKVK